MKRTKLKKDIPLDSCLVRIFLLGELRLLARKTEKYTLGKLLLVPKDYKVNVIG